MKKIITGALLLCMVLSFTGCQFHYEKPSEMLEKLEGWAENLVSLRSLRKKIS